MAEKSKDRKIHRLTKRSLMRIGAVVSAAAAFATPSAEAKSSHQSNSSSANTYLLASARGSVAGANQSENGPIPPELRDVRAGALVLKEMLSNIRPNVVSSAFLELGAGTFMAESPFKNSHGRIVPKGKVAYMEFPQLAVVDGRIMARGLSSDGMTNDRALDSLSSRWVDISAKTVLFYYLQVMDPGRGYPLVLPVYGSGGNLASDAQWFNGDAGAAEGLQGPLRGTRLAFLTGYISPKYAAYQKKYWALNAKPGQKPRIPDIFKAPS